MGRHPPYGKMGSGKGVLLHGNQEKEGDQRATKKTFS